VAANLKRSAHTALGLAINCAVITVAGRWTHTATFRALKETSQVAAPGVKSAVYGSPVLTIATSRRLYTRTALVDTTQLDRHVAVTGDDVRS